jgi:hypothetical protein
MIENRQYERTDFEAEVELRHPSLGRVILKSRDVSDGGLFLIANGTDELPPIGSMVEVRALVFGDAAPILKATVVRTTADGIGLMYCIENAEDTN